MMQSVEEVKRFLEELINLPTGTSTANQLCSSEDKKIDLVVKEVSSPASAPTSQLQSSVSDSSVRYFAATNQIGEGGSVLVHLGTNKLLSATDRFQNLIEKLSPGCSVSTLFLDSENGVMVSVRPEPHVSVRLEGLSGTLYPLLSNDISSILAKVAFGTISSNNESIFWQSNGELTSSYSQKEDEKTLKNQFAIQLFDNEVVSGVSNDFVKLLRSHLLDGPSCLTHGSLTTDFLVAAVLRPQPKKIDLEALRGEDYPPDSAPPPAVGDLRIVGGSSSFLGPIGFDLGTLLAHLLIALSGARAKVRAEEKKCAKGGYAKYSSERARDRWVAHATALVDVIVDLFSGFSARIISSWDNQRDVSPSSATSSCCSDDHGSNCSDDGFWRHQISTLGLFLQSAIGFSACELGRCASTSLDTLSLSPLLREESEFVNKLLSAILLERGMEIASRITEKSIASETKEQGVETFLQSWGVIISLFAVIDKACGANRSKQETRDEASIVITSLLD